jgi:hypothetical protein
MSAIVLATVISQRLAPKDTIHPEAAPPGSRPGLSGPDQPRADTIPNSAVMLRVPTALHDSDSLVKTARALAHTRQGVLTVVDADGGLSRDGQRPRRRRGPLPGAVAHTTELVH